MSFFDKVKTVFAGGNASGKSALKVDKAVLMDKIRQSDLFKGLTPEQMEQLFSRMETLKVAKGEAIVREGDEGDYYYLLVSGTAQVSRRPQEGGEPKVVAELDEPKGFGEEALISNAKRNATITMTSDGIIMRLSKDGFNDYVKEPMLTWIPPAEAQKQVAKGAKWIDVRDEEEARQTHLHNAIAIQLKDIRARASELDKQVCYICYCENGRQSSTGAFLLKQIGFNVGVLRGGLQSLRRAGMTT